MQTWIKMIIAASTITLITVAGTAAYSQYFAKRRLMISTTTSLYETGLLDEIKRKFETEYGIVLNFIPVGTGIAIQQAKNGDVDLTLVHSPTMEKSFLEQGYGVCRKIIAYNFFVIVGPEEDPAGIEGLNVTTALKCIVEYAKTQNGKVWVSRGDNSGTHQKERSLWKLAGYDYTEISRESWYASAGSGMGQTLLMANEFRAYTLSDIGTYLKYSKENRIALKALITEEKELINVYSVMAVNPIRHPLVNFNDTITFIKFLVSEEGQQLIENYGLDEFGKSLFQGAVKILKEDSPSQIAKWIRDYAFFNGSECPPEYRNACPELYEGG